MFNIWFANWLTHWIMIIYKIYVHFLHLIWCIRPEEVLYVWVTSSNKTKSDCCCSLRRCWTCCTCESLVLLVFLSSFQLFLPLCSNWVSFGKLSLKMFWSRLEFSCCTLLYIHAAPHILPQGAATTVFSSWTLGSSSGFLTQLPASLTGGSAPPSGDCLWT